MNILVFNVGSASLKFQVIATPPDMAVPEQGRTVVRGAVEEFGAEATLSSFENEKIAHREKIAAADHRILTARAASRAMISSESSDCNIIKPFAHRASAGVSVGENAVLVLKARNK